MSKHLRKSISFTLIAAFVSSSLYIPQAQAGEMVMLRLPVPGVMVHLSPEYTPAHLQGLTIHPENALQFDFLVHKGDGQLDSNQKKQEYTKLVKYFLASLTIPDADQWVNLSPYEHNRIIKDDFGKTEMGRDLLSQDYLLKQITSSLMYPESGLGKAFWDKVYERAFKEYGTTNVPVNTFNKVWIIPDEAAVYESGNTVYILRNHLKVMLEEDYLSLKKHSAITTGVIARSPQGDEAISKRTTNDAHTMTSKIVKEIILPELEKEVNEGKNFAMLRQIYSGMILATWYKHALKESLLGQVYANKAKVMGVGVIASEAKQSQQNLSFPNASVGNPDTVESIYQKYLKAFKKGVFNYIKEDADKYSQQLIPRKYFAGGIVGITSVEMGPGTATRGFRDGAMKVENEKTGLDPQSFAGAKIIVTAATEGQIEEVYTDLTSVQVGIKKGLTDEDIKRKTQEIVDYLNRVHIIAEIRSGFDLGLSLKEIMARAESKVQNLINRAVSEKLADLDYEDIGRIAERIKYELSNIRYPGLVSVEFKSIDAAMSLEEQGYKKLGDTSLVIKDVKEHEMILINLAGVVNLTLFKRGGMLDDYFIMDKSHPNLGKIITKNKPLTLNRQNVAELTGLPPESFPLQVVSKDNHLTILSKDSDISLEAKTETYYKREKALQGENNKPAVTVSGTEPDAAMTVEKAKKMVEDALKELKENLAPEGLDPKLLNLENEFKLFKDLTKIPEVSIQLTKLIEEYRSRPSTFYSEVVKDKIIGKLSSVNREISRALYRERRMSELPMVVSSPFAPSFYTDVMGAISERMPIKIEPVPTSNSTPLSLSERFRLWVQIIDRQVRNKLNTGNKTSTNDAAMKVKDLGGIDLNAANLNLQIKRDGRGVPLPLLQQDWAQLNQIQGFIPTIIEIRPVTTLPILSELQQKLRAS